MIPYKKAAHRREEILEVACTLAEESHFNRIRRHHLVDACGTAAGNISRVMGSMEQMRALLIEFAIENNRSQVIAQAIIDRHPSVAHLNQLERGKVFKLAVL